MQSIVDVMPRLQFGYARGALPELLADPQVLTVIGFGRDAPEHDDPRYLQVQLEPHGAAPFEVWRSAQAVTAGRDGELQWAQSGDRLFGALLVDEAAVGGIVEAARIAYSTLLQFCTARGFTAPLRFWNYIDAITVGDGDDERYRGFNRGRAAGIAGRLDRYPAATAIGRHDGSRRLQVYWLAGRMPGRGIENPRQVSAFHYPRQYGPQPPSFARATLADDGLPLLISGTASVVGHASVHPGDLDAQLGETLRNIDSLIGVARQQRPALPSALGSHSLVKVYVRNREDMPRVEARLRERLAPETPLLLLHAEVCRRELLVEIDSCHG